MPPVESSEVKTPTRPQKTRITVWVPSVVDRNIEAVAFVKEQGKTAVIVEALEEYLRKREIDPNKSPARRWVSADGQILVES